MNSAATAFFDLHLQLQIKVACFVSAIDDVVVALRLAFERFAHHDAVFDAPDAGVSVPSGKALAVEDLLVAGVLVNVIGRGVMKFGHTRQLLAVWTGFGWPYRGRLQRRRHGLSDDRCRKRQYKDSHRGCGQEYLTNKTVVGGGVEAMEWGHGGSGLPIETFRELDEFIGSSGFLATAFSVRCFLTGPKLCPAASTIDSRAASGE